MGKSVNPVDSADLNGHTRFIGGRNLMNSRDTWRGWLCALVFFC